jgi:hypothetical protein
LPEISKGSSSRKKRVVQEESSNESSQQSTASKISPKVRTSNKRNVLIKEEESEKVTRVSASLQERNQSKFKNRASRESRGEALN